MKKKAKKKNTKTSISFFGRIGMGKDRDYFIENLSVLVSSGMSIPAAFDSIIIEVRSARMKQALTLMKADVEDGSALWRALLKTRIFSKHTVSLIRIGEESGKLVENLKVIGAQQEKERAFSSKIRSAMMYPILVLGLTFIIGIGIAWFILPKLANVFSQLRIKLPLITEILIKIGTFFGEYGLIAVPSFIAFVVASMYFVFYHPKTKFMGQNILFVIPGIWPLIQEIELSRFGYLLGTLLQAGLSVTEAMDSLEQASTFFKYKALYRHLKAELDEGNSFQKSFLSYPKRAKLIPAPVQQLIVAGEQSGRLPELFIKIGENYEAKMDMSTKNLTVILEPILLVVVWLGVVAVALAVILPVYGLVGGLKTN